ncbi:7003_t:CDS:2 [Funneliformis geosporum]|nr:7003_t:CDS:2 [Funneliformis geosporum]
MSNDKKRRQWYAREKLLIVNHAEHCGSKRLAKISDLRKNTKAITQNMVIRKAKLVAKEKK